MFKWIVAIIALFMGIPYIAIIGYIVLAFLMESNAAEREELDRLRRSRE